MPKRRRLVADRLFGPSLIHKARKMVAEIPADTDDEFDAICRQAGVNFLELVDQAKRPHAKTSAGVSRRNPISSRFSRR